MATFGNSAVMIAWIKRDEPSLTKLNLQQRFHREEGFLERDYLQGELYVFSCVSNHRQSEKRNIMRFSSNLPQNNPRMSHFKKGTNSGNFAFSIFEITGEEGQISGSKFKKMLKK